MLVSLGALCALTAPLGQAQTPPAAAPKVVAGVVTSIDASAKQLKVKADDGVTYAVALQDNTIYLRMPPNETDQKKAVKIAFSDVTVGDRLLTRGPLDAATNTVTVRTVLTMTKADVAQKQKDEQSDWQKRGITGIVAGVNPGANEITISTRGRDTKTIVLDASGAGFHRYALDSVRFADAKPSSIGEVQIGDTVRALGDKSNDGSHFKAQEIVAGAFQTIAATVNSVDPATGEVRVTDLQTKKAVTVKTSPASMLRRLDERTAGFLARRLHPDAAGAGRGAPEGAPGQPASGAPATPDSNGGGLRGALGGPGGGPGGGGNFDLQQVLERSPQLSLPDLKKGDALIISSAKGADNSTVTAISLVAGVEPFLSAAPKTGGQVNLGSWNLEAGVPEQ
jgi:Cu/Ag efflux protein CusF